MTQDSGSKILEDIGRILEETDIAPSKDLMEKMSTVDAIILTNQINTFRILGKIAKLIWLETNK